VLLDSNGIELSASLVTDFVSVILHKILNEASETNSFLVMVVPPEVKTTRIT